MKGNINMQKTETIFAYSMCDICTCIYTCDCISGEHMYICVCACVPSKLMLSVLLDFSLLCLLRQGLSLSQKSTILAS